MSDPTFNTVTIRQATGAARGDLLTIDTVDGDAGNGGALRFLNNSAGGLSLALARVSASRVDASTVRLDLGVAGDPSLSSGDDTPALLSLEKGAGPPRVSTAASATLAVGGPLSVTGAASLSGGLSVSGAASLNGGLTVTGAASMGNGLSVTGDMSLSGTLNGRNVAADGASLSAHLANTANPHGTTAAQIGALAVAGGTVSGGLDVQGRLGVGLSGPGFALDVGDRARVRQGPAGTAGIWLFQTGPGNDRAFVGMAGDSSVGLWGHTGAGWGLTMDTGDGDVTLTGNLSLPKAAGGNATLSKSTFSNESSLNPNNLKLIMGNQNLQTLGSPGISYEFAVGHTQVSFTGSIGGGIGGIGGGGVTPIRFRTTFRKVFSVNQNGDAFFAGGKGGYVVDHFVNRVGDTLEVGDVVVISASQATLFTGTDNNIPLPEVDLSDQAYDRRVCGIVASAVADHELPPVEEPGAPDEEAAPAGPDDPPYEHPLQPLGGGADYERTRVRDGQLGRMVTLGAFAHCKVDADIAPIAAGDLLTTSPTRGHAQKALDPERSAGAIVGKALAGLDKGKGTIPVIVTLH